MRIRLPIIESIAHGQLNQGLVSANFKGIDYKNLAKALSVIPATMEEIDSLSRKYLSQWVDFDAEPTPPAVELYGDDIISPFQEEYFPVDIPILSNNEASDDRMAFYLNACDMDLARTKHRLMKYSAQGVSIESYYHEVDLTLWKIIGYCNWLNFMYGDIYTGYGCEKPVGDNGHGENLVLIRLLQKHMLKSYAELTVIFAPQSPAESMNFVMEKTGALIQLGLSKLNLIRADILNKAQTCIRCNDLDGMNEVLKDFKKFSDDSSLDYINYSTVFVALINNLYLGGNHDIKELTDPAFCEKMVAKALEDKAGIDKAKLQAYADCRVFEKTIPGMIFRSLL
ncbi:MAG: hypothetical protein J5708_00565 [Bacteroidales bacterium]|nr:hypothetical protein [Bacteroidales bacterium]